MLPYPLTNHEIEWYVQNEPKIKCVYLQNNLPNMAKDRVQVVSLNEFESTWTDWVLLLVNGNKGTYFGSFGVEHIPEEIKKFIRSKDITANIYKVQAYDSIMEGTFALDLLTSFSEMKHWQNSKFKISKIMKKLLRISFLK